MMIPNEIRLGLNFDDLPARATQVAPKALNLSGGKCQVRELRANGGRGARTPTSYGFDRAYKVCASECGKNNQAILQYDSPSNSKRSSLKYFNCKCCSK